MTTKHRLRWADFDALASGHGNRSTVDLLGRADLSRHLLRLRDLLDATGPLESAAYDLLAGIEQRAPRVVSELLSYPQVAAWSARCLRRLRRDRDVTDLAHLRSIAAAAMIRTGLEGTVTVPVRRGWAALPMLGAAEVGPAAFDGTALVSSGPHGVLITTEHRTVAVPADFAAEAPGWSGLRRLHATCDGCRLEVYLDDIDPFRDNYRLAPAPRLPAEAVAGWRHVLQEAWSVLVRHHRGRAEALAAGLRAFVPLTMPGVRSGLSATSAQAPGAIAITPPEDPLLLAESLVHEFQHGKLCTLLELVPIHEADDGARFYAPWRDDPRPLEGLLQGAYAYLGVTDFWRCQQEVMTGDEAAYAQYSFVLWRDQTLLAVADIESSGRLTAAGHRFVAGMRAALERWADTPVTLLPARLAEDTSLEHVLTWRIRHLRPDAGTIDRIAAAWPARIPEPVSGPAELFPSEWMPGACALRAQVRHLRLRFPARFEELRAGRDVDAAGLAQVREDHRTAIDHYRARLSDEPGDDEAWSGLAVSAWRDGADEAAEVLVRHPEVVAAVHRRIAALGTAPDPLELADWLEPAVRGRPAAWTARG